MKIETFEALLKKYNGDGARAYIPSKNGTRQTRVAVAFKAGGKVYHYRGTIRNVAEHLGLIPEMNVVVDSKRVVGELLAGKVAIGYAASSDTIAWLLNERGIETFDHDAWESYLEYVSVGVDEYDYPQVEYKLRRE